VIEAWVCGRPNIGPCPNATSRRAQCPLQAVPALVLIERALAHTSIHSRQEPLRRSGSSARLMSSLNVVMRLHQGRTESGHAESPFSRSHVATLVFLLGEQYNAPALSLLVASWLPRVSSLRVF
jgi:hypothetical protein